MEEHPLTIKGRSMYWEKNKQALVNAKATSALLLEQLDEMAATDQATLFHTQAGDYTLNYKGIPLHSLKGAVSEATETVCKTCRPAMGRAHLILGLGLGYAVEETFQQSPGKIVVYEPDLALLKFILENVDLAEYLGSGRVWIAVSPNNLLETLSPMVACEDPLDIIALPGYAMLMHQEIPALMEQLFALVDERIRDYHTGKHFHMLWIRQFLQNTIHFDQTLISNLWQTPFLGKPALIIGRGPSLDQALEELRRLASSMVLIAAGSALRRLWEAGITPDIAVFYDANGMHEQLHGLPQDFLNKIIFLISPFTQACCFEAPAKAKVLFFPKSGEPFSEWFTQSLPQAKEPLVLEGGGTVSLIALQTAMALHCDPIVLIGQDLAFPGNQVYAGGIELQTDTQGRMNLPKSETLYTGPEELTTVLGQNGERLPALKAYASFIRHFERIAQANQVSAQPIKLFNASLGGADLQGYCLKPLSAFQNELHAWKKPAQTTINAELSGAHRSGNNDENQILLLKSLENLHQVLDRAIELHEALLLDTRDSQSTNEAIFDLLNDNPLISHFLMFELMGIQKQYNPKPKSPADIERNKTLLKQSTINCRDILRDHILPWVIEAERNLYSQNKDNAIAIPVLENY